MLNISPVMTFLAVSDRDRAREFYGTRLGLPLLADEPMALVFDVNGTLLRISPVETVAPTPYTVLGWEVASIEESLAQLHEVGIEPERWEGFPLEPNGSFHFPDGTKVAWFKDPDGNVLSLTQFLHRPGLPGVSSAAEPRFLAAFAISGETDAVPIRELAPALAFYTRILGFTVESRTATGAVLRRDAAVIGLVKSDADPEQVSVYFSVENVSALHSELTAASVEPSDLMPSQHGGRKQTIFFAKEPYGVCFCFGENQN